MSPLDGAKPFSKEAQLARGSRRYHRKVASPKRWQQIADAKQGVCRACPAPPPNQLAHLISRAQGGPDSEWNIVPLCPEHHALFDQRDPQVCRLVAAGVTDREYAGLVSFGGEQVFEARFGVKYGRAA